MTGGMRPLVLLSLALTLCPPPVTGQGLSAPDFEFARDAVERGEILPLAEVLARLQDSHPGRVVEVEFEDEDGILAYEIGLVTADGRLIEVELDARTGRILALDEDDADDADEDD